jgi:hypothetical protein
MSMCAVGLVCGRPQSLRQRQLLQKSRLVVPIFRPALALIGPSLGLLPLWALFRGGPGWTDIVTIHVLVWSAVLWPTPDPLVRYCMLREVIPRGGADPAQWRDAGFEEPPEGSLRLDPRNVKTNRIVHLWTIPVRDGRLQAVDDGVQVPWGRPGTPKWAHVLGTAAFEPSPLTLLRQTDEVTIRVNPTDDTLTLRLGDAQTRRLVVLRAYLPPGVSATAERAAYRWEDGVAAASRQVIDGNTTEIRVRDGDLIVASSEGVARAYEVVFGEAVRHQLERTPQVEDYVGNG